MQTSFPVASKDSRYALDDLTTPRLVRSVARAQRVWQAAARQLGEERCSRLDGLGPEGEFWVSLLWTLKICGHDYTVVDTRDSSDHIRRWV